MESLHANWESDLISINKSSCKNHNMMNHSKLSVSHHQSMQLMFPRDRSWHILIQTQRRVEHTIRATVTYCAIKPSSPSQRCPLLSVWNSSGCVWITIQLVYNTLTEPEHLTPERAHLKAQESWPNPLNPPPPLRLADHSPTPLRPKFSHFSHHSSALLSPVAWQRLTARQQTMCHTLGA